MTGAPIDLMDQTFVVADPMEVAAYFAQPEVWARWWPELQLTVTEDRGDQGMRWAVAGELSGTAEVWLEPWHDGVIVHWFLRAGPEEGRRRRDSRRLRRHDYTVSFKAHIHELKDRLERGRPAGVPRAPSGR